MAISLSSQSVRIHNQPESAMNKISRIHRILVTLVLATAPAAAMAATSNIASACFKCTIHEGIPVYATCDKGLDALNCVAVNSHCVLSGTCIP
jgi:hypothetical protein